MTRALVGPTRETPTRVALACMAFAMALTLVTVRTFHDAVVPGHPELARYGLRDFRDAVYYPVRALVDGNDPYRPSTYRTQYPVGSKFPLYAPLILAFHLPFALLPERAGGIAHYAFNVGCTILLAFVSLRLCGIGGAAATLALSAAMLLSRPGHTNLFTGECTAYVCLGTYLALGWSGSSPALGGIGLALAAMKPTFGVPLGLLMLARPGERRAFVYGVLIAAPVTAVVLAIVVHAEGGVAPFLAAMRENYSSLGTTGETYSGGSVIALDAGALVERLLGRTPGAALARVEATVSVAVLALGIVVIRRIAARTTRDARLAAATVACMTILLCVHHHAYDALLLALPIAALVSGRCAPTIGPRLRWVLSALLLVPWVNYFATFTFLDRWEPDAATQLVITSANGAALVAALLVVSVALLAARTGASETAG